MRKKLIFILAALFMALPLAAVSPAARSAEAKDAIGTARREYPVFSYQGQNPVIRAALKYYMATFGPEKDENYFGRTDVMIPIPVILKIDTDEEGADLWGNIWTINYDVDVKKKTLIARSGGEMPCWMRLKATDGGYYVTDFEKAGDGAAYAADIRRFCAKKEMPEEEARLLYASYFTAYNMYNENTAKVRMDYIKAYLKSANLDIRKIKDFGKRTIKIPKDKKDR